MQILRKALADINNYTILWPRYPNGAKERLQQVHEIAKSALRAYGTGWNVDTVPECNEFGISEPVLVVHIYRGEQIAGIGQYFSGPGQWTVSPAPAMINYPQVVCWNYILLPDEQI